jgi:hypothetical protein
LVVALLFLPIAAFALTILYFCVVGGICVKKRKKKVKNTENLIIFFKVTHYAFLFKLQGFHQPKA